MNEQSSPEHVVLLDDQHHPIGTALKSQVHTEDTPLHLAFSCHVLNTDGQVLVTRRALDKRTWPGVWTNSFCGHPGPDEPFQDAIARRARQELGMEVRDLAVILPQFSYRATDASGIVENEFCPVYVCLTDAEPEPAAAEVVEYAWVDPARLASAVADAPFAFSPWLAEQVADPLLRAALA
ncbi:MULTISPECIES: isopentenyl-diphosphate Delta-isomerase [Kocuria]|uniref:Isopentenyl-diphosphate Delta-isomerase n=2 Tax=Kocuria TaxID=57493 RepID=A0A7D7Q7P6_KOCVA|nr:MULTISPECIES: isopentenyl-diphosphate Delta-isomerase [Kocuria]MBS6030916.1 isopentenyl-diphosphate Delta-isomerase [Kocuria rhizophila]WNB88789.1 isopentenyl-diphosphate Delta-isomerase [Glutamicibacter protophormiae]MDN5631403.1 isopentenyl-diphosphate Delta-isomerase [Kocuria sp.]QMS55703.1 Isopentenyl-diphosphate Delta-isomerase [Kocuria varians]RUP85101.1 isopentenyl-diphosphate Delta-isomerase [Kocuria sp. HSID17590]